MNALLNITPNLGRSATWRSAKHADYSVYSVADRHRFAAKVREDASGCWLWTASTFKTGYGQFGWQAAPRKQKSLCTHRVAYELSHGSAPDGYSVLHRCDTPLCCNPSHLFLGTQLDNMRDAAGKRRLSVPRPKRQKLTTAQLSEIDALIAGGSKQVDVARWFDVSKTFISLYLRGKRRQYDAPRMLKEQVV